MNEIDKLIPENVDFRTAILEAERVMLQGMTLIDNEVIHHFAPGIYMRELRIKKGTVLTGKIHKHEHLCVLNGDIEIASQDGKGRFTGYLTFLSKPGVKRIGYAHEDTVFTTVHAISGCNDIEELEKALVCDTFAEYDRFLLQSDYHRFLVEFGFTESQVRFLSERTDNFMEFPKKHAVSVEVKESRIEGVGLFASKNFQTDDIIALAKSGGKRTPAGRYVNHSHNPNCEYFKEEHSDDICLIAAKNIDAGDELTINYRQAAIVNGWRI